MKLWNFIKSLFKKEKVENEIKTTTTVLKVDVYPSKEDPELAVCEFTKISLDPKKEDKIEPADAEALKPKKKRQYKRKTVKKENV